jgi:hypothetical protein
MGACTSDAIREAGRRLSHPTDAIARTRHRLRTLSRLWLRRAAPLGMAALLTVAIPGAAFACPVCGLAGSEDANGAYLAITLVLSALPLAMIGGVVVWIRRRVNAADHDEG